MRDSHSVLAVFLLVVVLSLGATAMVYDAARHRAPAPVTETVTHPKGVESKAPYLGPLPASFTIQPAFSGPPDSAPFGFALLNDVRIAVDGSAASAKSSVHVDEPAGTGLRRTGVAEYVLKGTLDRKTDRITGTITVTEHVRENGGAGTPRDVDYRYTGALSCHFAGASSLTGSATGTSVERDTLLGPGVSPGPVTTKPVWSFEGIRR